MQNQSTYIIVDRMMCFDRFHTADTAYLRHGKLVFEIPLKLQCLMLDRLLATHPEITTIKEQMAYLKIGIQLAWFCITRNTRDFIPDDAWRDTDFCLATLQAMDRNIRNFFDDELLDQLEMCAQGAPWIVLCDMLQRLLAKWCLHDEVYKTVLNQWRK